MAGGKVYTVVSSVMRSFKLGTSGDIIGALTTDEYSAVSGRIGAKPKMVPLSIRVERYNDPSPRTYECQVAYNDALTGQLVRSAIAGAALQLGTLPPDHTVEYTGTVNLADGQAIHFENVSTGEGLLDPVAEMSGDPGVADEQPVQHRRNQIRGLRRAGPIGQHDRLPVVGGCGRSPGQGW